MPEPRPPLLPGPLVARFKQEFATLASRPTPDEVGQVLTSLPAQQLVGDVLSSLSKLEDGYFRLSGPGGFYYSRVVAGPAGFVKLHLFAPPDLCNGVEAPHTHRSLVISAVYSGSITNTVFQFEADSAGDRIVELALPNGTTQADTDIRPVIGNVSVRAQQQIEGSDGGNLYAVALDEIHSSATVSGHAVTLCYFGPQVSIGKHYNPANRRTEQTSRNIRYRPSDLVRE